ncbi:MAG: GMC family oxidoreductase [Gammaproteobacteria bacterium]
MSKTLEKREVVIVGAGAAGSTYAALLAEAGRDVLVLERGTARKLGDLYSSQTWARRLKWGAPTVVQDGADSIWYNFNAGHGYGGAALHHYGVWPRFHPEDMELQSRYGRGLDWPFGYDELRPYYDQVQKYVGIAGDAEQEIWRPPGEPYPLPPVLINNHGHTLAKGFHKLGMHTAPVPVAVLSQPYNGRPACIWDGWCDAGCPTGALANPLVTYKPRAEQAGAGFQAHTAVTRLLTDDSGKRVTAVEYYDQAGEHYIQPADVVVLCAFTVENSRLLLNSANRQHRNGLANSSDAVGRYIMSHPAAGIFGMFREQMDNYLGITGGQIMVQSAYDKTGDPDGAFGSRQWLAGLALKPNDLLGIAMTRPDLYGAALEDFMQRAVRHMGAMVGVIEDQAEPDNRVRLADAKDPYGMPIARVTYRASEDGRRLWQTALQEGMAVMRAAGAEETWHGPRGAQHIMGGTIMGRDSGQSVTNGHGQTHDVKNLFIGGPSLFPCSSCVNSTFTVHALATKSAAYLIGHWTDIV